MSRDRAILAVAPDKRQESILQRVFPSWERYAKRHALEIIVLRFSITQGRHPYWDRWLSVQPGVAETARFENLLLLDNDVHISANAADVFDYWDGTRVGIVEESAQGPWDPAGIPSYYRRFHVDWDDRMPSPAKVFNMGVCVLGQEKRQLFQVLFDKWREVIRPRFSATERSEKDIFYRLEADGPFLSYELQARHEVSPLPAKFNFFLPAWLEANAIGRLPFLLRAKAAQRLESFVPRPFLQVMTGSARQAVRRAEAESHFLHFAASKSPLWLLDGAGEGS